VSDERVRAAETEWRRLGSVDAGARWLVERVRAGLNRRFHLEWLAFLGDAPSAAALDLLEPRGRGGSKASVRARLDARESSLDPGERAESAQSDLFWYSLIYEDREAAMRALLAALERARAPGEAVARLARVVVHPTREAALACVERTWRPGAIAHACAFAAAPYAVRPANPWDPPAQEMFYDAMSDAGREGGKTEVTRAVLAALRAWWIDADDIARRLAGLP
jgi:hypothetical protein